VFSVEASNCVIRPAAERYFPTLAEKIKRAAKECPVDVIVVDEAVRT